MKKYLLILFLLPAISFAQFLNTYTAEEGYSAALAGAEADLTEPVLTAIVVNIGLDFSVASVSFDEETGESNLFAYVFYEKNDINQAVLVPIINTFGQYIDARTLPNVPEVPKEQFEELIGGPISETWADSDVFADVMGNSSEHNELKLQYSDAELALVGLITNGDETSPDFGKSFWGYQYQNSNEEDLFFCAMDAIATQNTFCEVDVNTVIDISKTNADFGPNPAVDYHSITMGAINSNTKIQILNIYGINIDNNLVEINGNTININTSNIAIGTYFVNIHTDSGNYISKFIKSE